MGFDSSDIHLIYFFFIWWNEDGWRLWWIGSLRLCCQAQCIRILGLGLVKNVVELLLTSRDFKRSVVQFCSAQPHQQQFVQVHNQRLQLIAESYHVLKSPADALFSVPEPSSSDSANTSQWERHSRIHIIHTKALAVSAYFNTFQHTSDKMALRMYEIARSLLLSRIFAVRECTTLDSQHMSAFKMHWLFHWLLVRTITPPTEITMTTTSTTKAAVSAVAAKPSQYRGATSRNEPQASWWMPSSKSLASLSHGKRQGKHWDGSSEISEIIWHELNTYEAKTVTRNAWLPPIPRNSETLSILQASPSQSSSNVSSPWKAQTCPKRSKRNRKGIENTKHMEKMGKVCKIDKSSKACPWLGPASHGRLTFWERWDTLSLMVSGQLCQACQSLDHLHPSIWRSCWGWTSLRSNSFNVNYI